VSSSSSILCCFSLLPLLVGVGAPLGVAGAEAAAERGDHYIWVDGNGVTQLTNDSSRAAEEVEGDSDLDTEDVAALWDDGIIGAPLTTPAGAGGTPDDRVARLLSGARADLARGEQARATATLRSLVRLAPSRPEAYWYLAMLDKSRGRYASAQAHLRDFIGRAQAVRYAKWRAVAEQRLAVLEDERRLADADAPHRPLELVRHTSDHFRIELDSELDLRPSYSATVLGYLERAHADVAEQLGVEPSEKLGVVFYGRAAYQRAHQHRFSFQTVGFFDGRIHVSASAEPGLPLEALLYHEYTHAVFREQTGGDRPYWLNEGLAELVERRAKEMPTSTRSERASLRTRIAGGDWIALRRIDPSFSGLKGDDARAAYLQSIVTAEYIEQHTEPAVRARLLRRIGEGWSADQALHEALGKDTDSLDAAVQKAIRDEFPEIAH
jgi:hypothetical protein